MNTYEAKGQLISKGLVGILNSSKKRTKKFDIQYYDTSGWLVFVRFLEELKTSKSPFEMNWPLIWRNDEGLDEKEEPRLCTLEEEVCVLTRSDNVENYIKIFLGRYDIILFIPTSFSSVVNLTATFLKVVQCQPRLNHQTQPFWVKGVWLVPNSQIF